MLHRPWWVRSCMPLAARMPMRSSSAWTPPAGRSSGKTDILQTTSSLARPPVTLDPAVRRSWPTERSCTLGVGGIFSCLDAATGKVLWRKQSAQDYLGTEYQFDSSMSPLVVDGRCIVHVGGKGKGAIIAFDLASGESKWKCDGDAPANSSPMVMTVQGVKQIVMFTAKNLVGLGLSDGKPLWQVPSELKMGNNTTPIVDGQTVICIGEGKGLTALKIEKQGDGFAATPLWTNTQLGARFTTPVLKDGLLFGYGTGLFCASAKTGEVLWTDVTKRGQTAAIVDAGSCLTSPDG